MNFSAFIARRYLFAPKSHNIINLITLISVVAVSLGTAALIIVLSVFNGFESLVVSLYNSFDPHIKIIPASGKSFEYHSFPAEEIKSIDGVEYFTEVIEDNALIKYQDRQYIATIKGVSKDFSLMTGIDSLMVAGEMNLGTEKQPMAVMGYGVAYNLTMGINDFMNPLSIYVPNVNKQFNAMNTASALKYRNIRPSGFFSIQHEFDSKFVIVPISFARELFDKGELLSAVEIGLTAESDMKVIQEQLADLLGEDYIVKNRFQQQELLYKIMKSEKLAVFIILSLILLVAAFNLIGSVSLIIIDKTNDIQIFKSMGLNMNQVKKIFFMEGILITMIGSIIGLTIGLLVGFLQQQYGIVKLGQTGSFVVDAYPVVFNATDFIYIFATVGGIGMLSSMIPLKIISRNN